MKNAKKTIFNRKYEVLVAKLVKIRKNKGLTQRDLAKELGVPHCYVARTEIRERRLDVVELVNILKALKVSRKEVVDIIKGLL
jgi:transcriptional regulator with XRE-family HTH domain